MQPRKLAVFTAGRGVVIAVAVETGCCVIRILGVISSPRGCHNGRGRRCYHNGVGVGGYHTASVLRSFCTHPRAFSRVLTVMNGRRVSPPVRCARANARRALPNSSRARYSHASS